MELDAVNAIHNAIEPCFGRFKLVLLALFKTCDIVTREASCPSNPRSMPDKR
jgi:hypothetical protein